jgi:hypothetical protein
VGLAPWSGAAVSPRAWLRRCARLTLVVVAVASLGLVGAAPAAAAIDCTPMGDPACRTLTPVVECVWPEADGTRTVVWGYVNPSGQVLHIDVGAKNKMTPGPEGQGQPTDFQVGEYRNVFVTNVPGTTADWRLGNITASLSAATATCPTKPVPLVGDVAALALYLLALAVAVPAAVRRRDAGTLLARAGRATR